MPIPQATKETQSGGASLPKGAVHLVINSDSQARKIFTYFRYSPAEAPPGTTGLYRLEVSPDGTVAAVTILKSMGSTMDATSMKEFAKWRAEPGPLRIVDVGQKIRRIHRVISR
jgi:outer membrane biosynthesis protein TonB